MVSTELINTLKRLDRSSQFYVMQILLQELVTQESEAQTSLTKTPKVSHYDPLLKVIGSLESPPLSAMQIEAELYG